MVVLVAESCILIIWRRRELAPERALASIWSRESLIFIAMIALLLMAATTILGTVSTALSGLVTGQPVMVGAAFYNNVLIPTGLVLLASTAVAPLLRWGKPPLPPEQRWLLFSLRAGLAGSLAGWLIGMRHWIELSVIGLAVLAVVALCGSIASDTERQRPGRRRFGWLVTLREQRRQYAGFLLHLGFVCLAIGVAGSSLGKREQLFVMAEGDTVAWAGREVRLARLLEREAPDKLIAEAELEINVGGRPVATLRPAQHFYLLQQQWTTEVAIHSTWSADFYTILHSRDSAGRARLTLVENPLMRWMWLGGWIIGAGTLVRLWPVRRRAQAVPLTVAAPANRRDVQEPDDMAAAA
jgi:cytochrome c-type biogenesis protein CcmF